MQAVGLKGGQRAVEVEKQGDVWSGSDPQPKIWDPGDLGKIGNDGDVVLKRCLDCIGHRQVRSVSFASSVHARRCARKKRAPGWLSWLILTLMRRQRPCGKPVE